MWDMLCGKIFQFPELPHYVIFKCPVINKKTQCVQGNTKVCPACGGWGGAGRNHYQLYLKK